MYVEGENEKCDTARREDGKFETKSRIDKKIHSSKEVCSFIYNFLATCSISNFMMSLISYCLLLFRIFSLVNVLIQHSVDYNSCFFLRISH